MARHRRLRRGLLLAGVALFVVLLFTAWQAWHVRSSLLAAKSHVSSLTTALASGRTAQAEQDLHAAQDEAGAARRHSRGPVWWTASKLPWVGDDVTAVRTVADVADGLADRTLPDLVALGDTLSPASLRPEDGRMQLKPLKEAQPVVARTAAAVSRADDRVSRLDTSGLMGPLKAPVADLQTQLSEGASMAGVAAKATRLLPSMLGDDGKRTYLLIFQNNAEIRATGGLAGAMAVITADHGRVTLSRQMRPADLGYFAEPVVPLTEGERAVYTERPAQFPQDTVMIPDFPRAASILARMWDQTQGGDVDGVISVDPVAMSHLLRGTGPIPTPLGTITADNAVDLLLRDVYLKVPSDEAQNAYFADVARSVFDRVLNAPPDPRAMLDGLARGVEERRVLLWSDHPGEQRTVAGEPIAGELPTRAGERPEVGVYLNDSGSDKLTYYLDEHVGVRPVSCGSTGKQVIDVKVTLRSTVPEDAPLTEWVVGPGSPGLPLGDMRLTVYGYAPVGGGVDSLSVDGEEIPALPATHAGREVGFTTVDIPRGGRRVIEYQLRSGPGQVGPPHVLVTPTVNKADVEVGGSAC